MEVLWECLEFRKRDVAADGEHQSEHDEKDGSKEEGRYLVHGQFGDSASMHGISGVLEVMSDVLETAGHAFGERVREYLLSNL